MTRLFVVAASLGLSLSAGYACEYQRSAEARIDQTVVASVNPDANMSTPEQVLPPVDQTAPVKAAE